MATKTIPQGLEEANEKGGTDAGGAKHGQPAILQREMHQRRGHQGSIAAENVKTTAASVDGSGKGACTRMRAWYAMGKKAKSRTRT